MLGSAKTERRSLSWSNGIIAEAWGGHSDLLQRLLIAEHLKYHILVGGAVVQGGLLLCLQVLVLDQAQARTCTEHGLWTRVECYRSQESGLF